MRALYGGFPSSADLEEAGLSPEECTTPNPDGMFYDCAAKRWWHALWAENWPPIQFFSDIMESQWRHGPAGPTGLDYVVLLHELDRRALPRDEYDDLFGSLRIIERAALVEIHKA